MNNRHFLIGLFLVSNLLLVACGYKGPVKAYTGPEKAAQEIARVIIPAAVTLEGLNGRDLHNVPSLSDGVYELHLPAGKHDIAFVYEQLWNEGAQEVLYKSSLVAIQGEFEAGQVYYLNYTRPQSTAEAFELSLNFSATITNSKTGQSYLSRSVGKLGLAATQRENKTSANNGQPVNSQKHLRYWWLLADKEQKQQFIQWRATVPDDVQSPYTTQSDEAVLSTKHTVPKDNLRQLKLWWLRATAKQRQTFIQWQAAR